MQPFVTEEALGVKKGHCENPRPLVTMTFAGKARITTTTRPFFGLADKGRKTSRGHKWVHFLQAK